MHWGSRLRALLTSAPHETRPVHPALPRHHHRCGRLRPLWQIPNCEILRLCADQCRAQEAEPLDAPIPTKPSLPAQDYRLAGERCLADSWKARAEDNLAAIRLMTTIEAEARHARPEEQERLARFTAFGASDLADRIFRRAGDTFAPAWEDLGVELEGLVSRDDLANLKRATQYADYTPE